MGIWVDTDFGFDDLWALLVLRHTGIPVDGVSLVAGNSVLEQVCRNACGAKSFFCFDWPLFRGAADPIKRSLETAERILGPLGMQSRGGYLPQDSIGDISNNALKAMCHWIDQDGDHHVLAIGPLTNLALLFQKYKKHAERIDRIIWMGGSTGRGNHSPFAEYNAIADADALAVLLENDAPLFIVDLELCRRVTFDENDIPQMAGERGELLTDLIGGYLDIALSRGRNSMAVYDPLAAVAIACEGLVKFQPASLNVCTQSVDELGQTVFEFGTKPNVHIAVDIDEQASIETCVRALQVETNA